MRDCAPEIAMRSIALLLIAASSCLAQAPNFDDEVAPRRGPQLAVTSPRRGEGEAAGQVEDHGPHEELGE